jgi:hypothetical protein
MTWLLKLTKEYCDVDGWESMKTLKKLFNALKSLADVDAVDE